MKKIIGLLTAAVLLAGIFAGCGNTEKDTNTGNEVLSGTVATDGSTSME